MIIVKEIGVYQYNYDSRKYIKTDFNYITEKRELWLVGVNPISSKIIGNSNYSTDNEVKAHYIFRIKHGHCPHIFLTFRQKRLLIRPCMYSDCYHLKCASQ